MGFQKKENIMKRILIIIILAIVSLLAIGCKTTERSSRVQVEKSVDSVYLKVETIKSKPMQVNWVINEICDSIGNAKDFEQTITNGSDSLKVKMENNAFTFDWKMIDSIKSVAIENFKKESDSKETNDSREQTRNVVPGWCWYSVMINFVFLMVLGAWLSKKYF